MPTTLSARGALFIQHEEGFRADAYKDQVGVWTVGFGETQFDGRPVQKSDHLTLEQAQARFAARIAKTYAPAVARALDGAAEPVQQHQFDMLVSLTYNIGCAAFASSTLV